MSELLTTCPACGHQVSVQAEKCVQCGHTMPRQHQNAVSRRRVFAIVFTVFAAISCLMFALTRTPDTMGIAAIWSAVAIGLWVATAFAQRDAQ